MTELMQEIERIPIIRSEHVVFLQFENNNFFFQVRFEKWTDPALMFGIIYYHNRTDRTIFDATWSSTNNYQIEIKTKSVLSEIDMKIIRGCAKRIALEKFTNSEVKIIFNNLII
jgi:hypothetical protein